MNIKTMKTSGLSIALATVFLVAGAAGSSSVFAQDWRGHDRGYDGRVVSHRQHLEERKGFNDGLIIGRRDALARFSSNPSGSTRYQLGDFNYRQGFQSGYAQAYRKNANNYGSHSGHAQASRKNANNYGSRSGQAQASRKNANNYGSRNDDRYVRNNSYNRDGHRNDQYRQPGYYDRWGNYYYY